MIEDVLSVKRKQILCVDDEEEILAYYRGILDNNFDVVTASSGKHALQHIDSTRQFDLAIIDFKLLDVSGIELLKVMRKIGITCPIIIVSAYGSEDLVIKSLQSGATDYIKKPLKHGYLLKRVENHLFGFKEETESTEVKTPLEYLDTADPNYYRIDKVLKHVHANFMHIVRLDDAASIACMSKYYFCRNFKKIIGKNFFDYVNQLRITKAIELLEYSSMKITTIAHAVGYNDISYFEKMFKKRLGVTPSDFRSRAQSMK